MPVLFPSLPGVCRNTPTQHMPPGGIARFVAIGLLAAAAIVMVPRARAGIAPRGPTIPFTSALDDTLVVRDILQVPMNAGAWRCGSVPSTGLAIDGRVVLPVGFLDLPGNANAELHWYSPPAVVKEYDLDPDLSDAGGAQNNRQVLALSIPRRPFSAIPSDSLWASITYPLDIGGLDLSAAKYIEVWVNDWRDSFRIRDPGVILHIDLGVVSEDQMRAPDQPPNHLLDSEDLFPRDNLLLPSEDTGVDADGDADFDGLASPLDLSTANLEDRAGDDYGGPAGPYTEMDPRRWIRTNGTEANRSVAPLPDTEDLNLNGNLDAMEDYYEYPIDLSDGVTPFLATDVYAEFSGRSVPHPPRSDNGWRLYRIPIDAPGRLQFGAPQLSVALHMRVWVRGILSPDGVAEGNPDVMRPLLLIGGMRIRGEFPRSGAAGRPAVIVRTWPNPSRGNVTFALEVQGPRRVDLTVYDPGGRQVRRLSEGTFDAGLLRFTWDRRDSDGARVRPGLYLVRARGSDFTSSTRVLLLE